MSQIQSAGRIHLQPIFLGKAGFYHSGSFQEPVDCFPEKLFGHSSAGDLVPGFISLAPGFVCLAPAFVSWESGFVCLLPGIVSWVPGIVSSVLEIVRLVPGIV